MAFEINKEKIKALWGDISGKAQAAAETAAKKTGEVAESAKLTITLKSEEQKLARLFLGKLGGENVFAAVFDHGAAARDKQIRF